MSTQFLRTVNGGIPCSKSVDWRKPYGENWLKELIAQFDTPSGWSDSYWKLIRRYTADPLPWENQPPFYQPYEE